MNSSEVSRAQNKPAKAVFVLLAVLLMAGIAWTKMSNSNVVQENNGIKSFVMDDAVAPEEDEGLELRVSGDYSKLTNYRKYLITNKCRKCIFNYDNDGDNQNGVITNFCNEVTTLLSGVGKNAPCPNTQLTQFANANCKSGLGALGYDNDKDNNKCMETVCKRIKNCK